MHVSNFGGTFNQLFLWIFLWNFHRRCLSTSSIPWCKKVKNDQKLKSRGGGPAKFDCSVLRTRTKETSCCLGPADNAATAAGRLFGKGCCRLGGIREVKRIHETRRVRVRPMSLVKHSWRVEKRLSHWWRVADECDVKKMAHGRLPGSASKQHATASPPSRGRGPMH